MQKFFAEKKYAQKMKNLLLTFLNIKLYAIIKDRAQTPCAEMHLKRARKTAHCFKEDYISLFSGLLHVCCAHVDNRTKMISCRFATRFSFFVYREYPASNIPESHTAVNKNTFDLLVFLGRSYLNYL